MWTGPEYAAWYAQYMAYMGQMAAPATDEAVSEGGLLSWVWNGAAGVVGDAWTMVTHPVATAGGFLGKVCDTFLSGEAWDSFQGAVTGVPGAPLYVLTLGYVDLTDYIPPVYGHEDAYNSGWWVGAFVDVADAIVAGGWYFLSAEAPVPPAQSAALAQAMDEAIEAAALEQQWNMSTTWVEELVGKVGSDGATTLPDYYWYHIMKQTSWPYVALPN